MSEAVIEAESLSRAFGRKLAVADLSLTVRRGEVFGFLGPNGAGKTTSIKMLLGLVAPTSGEGRVFGAPLGERRVRARIGFLPEHFRFHDSLTSRELLRIHGRLQGLRGAKLESRIDELLERVNLSSAEHRPVRNYSKGMIQRAGLAQALINDPDLVVLDEPTSGLDPLGRVLVRELIEDLRRRGRTVFLSSHLLGDVEATCDRVAFLKDGQVVQEMSLSEARAALDVEIRVDRADEETVAALGKLAQIARVDGNTVHLRVESEETLPQIAQCLIGRGVRLYRLASRRKSLEEWFIETMGEDQRPG